MFYNILFLENYFLTHILIFRSTILTFTIVSIYNKSYLTFYLVDKFTKFIRSAYKKINPRQNCILQIVIKIVIFFRNF